MNEEVRHFSLRKLSIGLASVLVGVSIFGASQTVKADTVADQNTSAVTSNAQSSDTQKNENAVKSTFSSDNQADNAKSNLIQTQENKPKQAQTENGQQDSVSKTQEVNNSNKLQEKSAEKDIVRTSSLQESNNQSNTVTEKTVQHGTLEGDQKAQAFNLPKNSQKFNRKVLATNLSETASSPTTNGGFDEATWGKLDVNDWQGSVQDGVYQLTDYNGDLSHIIVPNEADFEKAGKSTNGLQVGITRDTISSIFSSHSSDHEQSTIAFSKTNNKKVKAVGTDWSNAFSHGKVRLSKFDGSNLDVSNVTNMSRMFYWNPIGDLTSGDLTSLANWDVSNVTNMSYMFTGTSISNLTPLANWDTSSVTTMKGMFGSMFSNDNSISDLTPLANWDTSKVTDMSEMFAHASISNLTGLAKWNVSNVTDMSNMFAFNSISDLTGLAKWDTSNVTDMNWMFSYNSINDLTPLANWKTSKVTNMSYMFEQNLISNLTGLAKWDTSNVTDMSVMFSNNQISNLSPLASWNTDKVTNMSYMFEQNLISNLTGLAKWDTSNVTGMGSMFSTNQISNLSPLANWNTSKVTNMRKMFEQNLINNLTGLANWKTGNVIGMGDMFSSNSIRDLTLLANWNVSNVTDMSGMFALNKISKLTGLANWDTSNVKGMDSMFSGNQISNLSPLTSWNTSNVTDISYMFSSNHDLIDLKPIANWNMSSVTNNKRFFDNDTKLDLTNINNTPLMQRFFKKPIMLQGSTFIINNVDFVTRLVKGITGKDVPILTNTAKRTIVFNIPHATPEKIVQTINYRAVAPVQVNWPAPPKSSGPVINLIVLASLETPASSDSNSYTPKIVKTYPVRESDWQLDDSKHNDAIIVNGQIRFASVKIPHINGYKAHLVPLNPALFTVSFIAVPTENKPSTPAEETLSKPSALTAPTDHTSSKPSAPTAPTENKPATPVEETPSKPSAPTDHPSNSAWSDLDHKVVNALNQADSGWTMPADNSTYKVDVPVNDAAIDLSDLVIAQPVHAQTRTQIRVTKHFKLRKHGKKHAVKHLKHRKRVSKLFSKRYALL